MIDAHCHLSSEAFDAEKYIQKSLSLGITQFIQGGYGPEDWNAQILLAQRPPRGVIKVTAAFGLHPWWVSEHSEIECAASFEKLRQVLIRHIHENPTRAIMLGETGLDGLRPDIEKQLHYFTKQIALAQETQTGIVLHVVRKHATAIKILRTRGTRFKGIIHSFSGSVEEALSYVELGFFISLSPRFLKLPLPKQERLIVGIPPDSIVLESDAPDATIEPESLFQVAAKICKIRGENDDLSAGKQLLKDTAVRLAPLLNR